MRRLEEIVTVLLARWERRRALIIGTLTAIIIVVVAGSFLARVPPFSISGAPFGATASSCASANRACSEASVRYSHSWYIDGSVSNADAIGRLGAGDAQWLSKQANANGCAGDFLTVLDFGRPTRKNVTNGSPLDDYAMSLFGHQEDWRTYHEVELLAEQYIDAWVAAASHCPRLYVALGTSNYAECAKANGPCDVNAAGRAWDIAIHDVATYVTAKGYGGRVLGVWVGDDLEASWDPWPTTEAFLIGVRDQERTYTDHAHLVDYGDADIGACSEVTGDCANPWTPENVYAAAWGLGWDVPLPETYSTGTTGRWESLVSLSNAQQQQAQGAPSASAQGGAFSFMGVMTECSGVDPLPTGGCFPQGGGISGAGACEWSPTIAYNHLLGNEAGHALTYATNIQWPDQPANALAASQENGAHAHAPQCH